MACDATGQYIDHVLNHIIDLPEMMQGGVPDHRKVVHAIMTQVPGRNFFADSLIPAYLAHLEERRQMVEAATSEPPEQLEKYLKSIAYIRDSLAQRLNNAIELPNSNR